MAPRVVERRDPRSRVLQDHDLSGAAGRFLIWGGLLYILAIMADVWLAWRLRGTTDPASDLLALNHTVDAFPSFLLATGMVYIGLWMRRSRALWAFRALAAWVTSMGVGALIVVGAALFQWSALAESATTASLHAAFLQTRGIGLLFVLVLVPLGIQGFRTRRRFG